VAWSNAITPHNAWQAVSVETVVGASGRVGVFLSADYRGYSRQFMAAFWDEVSLVVVTGGTAVPGATNTFTPTPTRTATPITGTPPPTTSATATATATASPLPSVTSLPPTPTGVPAFYVIKPGDTLGSIARRFGLSLRALIAANNIQDANRIFVGQVLVIRGGATPPPSATVIYVVQAGDNLTRIARRYNTTVAQIKAWNNLRSDVIFIGQRLVVGP
jgi:LysM repeat protein